MGTDIYAREIITALSVLGIDCFVGQSGGGTATLYIKLQDCDEYFLIGPGSYDWTYPHLSLFTSEDLYYGLDTNTFEHAEQYTVTPGASVTEIAEAIATAYRAL